MSVQDDPKAEYTRRLKNREAESARFSTREDRIANGRLAVFLSAVFIVAGAYLLHWVSWWWLLVPAAVFVGLAVYHERAIKAMGRARAAVEYYANGLMRLDGIALREGPTGQEFFDEDHPYAADLDLFGQGSLFNLLCTSQTKAGEKILADWLLNPADSNEISQRHDAIDELRHNNELREDLAVLGHEVRSSVQPESLARWATAPRLPFALWERAVGWGLGLGGALTAPAFAYGLFEGAGYAPPSDSPLLIIGPIPFVVILVLNVVIYYMTRSRVSEVAGGLDGPMHDLTILRDVLERLEQEPMACARLAALRATLSPGQRPASKEIHRLHGLVNAMEAVHNQIFAPFAFILMWRLHCAIYIEAWRARNGQAVAQWLDAVGQLEALCSLSAFAYENPENPYPEIVKDGPVVEGKALRHPLIRDCVPNDVALGRDHSRVLLVSGSNMSGKSTLLRTVGVNTVLALAGAPVCAEAFTVSPLNIGATLRIQDSIQEGESRFYAEILRLKQIVDLTKEEAPVLFLLDEILHGTNSHDRQVGAAGIIEGLIEAGAIGLVTTHDLAITRVRDHLGDRAANVHFVDHIEDGKLVFDYKLRPGVVEKSNALALMRAVGLDV